jgi:hypothetical protein
MAAVNIFYIVYSVVSEKSRLSYGSEDFEVSFIAYTS